MPTHEEVQRQLARFEPVHWLYDGLGGKVIRWTREHGGTSEDPAAQAFVLTAQGKVVARAENNATLYAPKAFARWLKEQADRYERDHPRTKVALDRTEVTLEGEGRDGKAVCAALDTARADNKPVLAYFGREPTDEDDRAARAQIKAARKFERTLFGSDTAADAAKAWTRLRFDLSRAEHRKLAKQMGVTKAPTLLLLPPGNAKPVKIPASTTGHALAHKLKKLAKAP